jgi:hypothetical protein
VEKVENFEFILPSTAGDGYVALAANSITFGDSASGAKSRIADISFQGGNTALHAGEELFLFQSNSPLDLNQLEVASDANGNAVLHGSKGISLLYDFSLDNTGLLTVTGTRSNPQTKALSEGQAAGLAFLTQGSDLIAGTGIRSAVSGANSAHGLSAFAATSGGWSRYDSGSHVDVSGVSVIAGLAYGVDLNPGRLTLGAFFEGGWGSYNSSNSFSNAASVDGDGDTSYVGGGILGRLDTAPLGPGKVYVEASGRMGNSSTDFSSSDLSDAYGNHARYDTNGTYYGLHVGLGYVW